MSELKLKDLRDVRTMLEKLRGEELPRYAADLLITLVNNELSRRSSAREGGANQWQPISTAPRDGTLVLVSFGIKGVRAVAWGCPWSDEVTDENGLWCVDDDKHGPYPLRGYVDKGHTAPTHWQPLPKAPCEVGEAGEAGNG